MTDVIPKSTGKFYRAYWQKGMDMSIESFTNIACQICNELLTSSLRCHKERANVCGTCCKACEWLNITQGHWHCDYKKGIKK